MRRSIVEEMRKQNQATLATILARNTARRLLGDKKPGTEGVLESGRKIVPEEKYETERALLGDEKTETKILFKSKGNFILKKCKSRTKDGFENIVKMDKEPIKLTGATIFREVGGQGGGPVVGTLEAHLDGFIFTTSSSHIYMQFTFKNVKVAFFRVEDEEEMLPLLHFHLHHPVEVGGEKTNDIQFRMVPAPVGQGRFDNDSDKFVKENQTRDKGRSEDLQHFVAKVQHKWRGSPSPFSFHWVYKQDEFYGVYKKEEFHGALPSKAPAVFGLPFFSLVRLADPPFLVVDLDDIEIVNLAKLRPGEIDMTVVFKDFRRELLQIGSVPLYLLDDIKRCLNFGGVKYYENDLNLPWDSIMKKIAASPETFIQDGGWNAYKLEDCSTSLYYEHYNLEASQIVHDDSLII
ncbi:hypothetical protein MKW92_044072 [Papaver armeniacum]|nr:hypothetical protein MKW92_044072 [Papaver armeniacum]